MTLTACRQVRNWRGLDVDAFDVLSVHNDLVRTVDDCRVSQLVLLDLSAAFDAMDH